MEMLNISPEAVIHLRDLFKRSGDAAEGMAIRLYISGLCNGGPDWSLSLDTYEPELDECCEFDEMRIIVERELLSAVGGLDVQYEADGEGGGFLITARDPDVQALYGGGCSACGGGCSGDCDSCHESCSSCRGGCHCHDE